MFMEETGILSGLGSIIGSGITAYANHYENQLAFERQKELNKLKYSDMVDAARQFGATPSAMISGILGSNGGSIPIASTSNNPVPDFGASLSSGIQASASQRQSTAALENAQAALTEAETNKQLGLMRLKFEPAKYFADVRKALAEAFSNTQQGLYHGALSKYYQELTNDVVKVRPWKIAGLRQGLLNDMVTYDKILQETKTGKAQEKYYKSAAHELETRSELNLANKEFIYNQSFNEHLRGFRLQYENTLLSYGIDPNKSFWENTGRLMYTNPKLFKERMDSFITGLNLIDGKLQDNLGAHYKRNIAVGYGLYKLNQIHQKNANGRSYRFNNAARTISSFIPLLGGEGVVMPSTAGVDWWLKD